MILGLDLKMVKYRMANSVLERWVFLQADLYHIWLCCLLENETDITPPNNSDSAMQELASQYTL
jgi:hypothetical protein